MGQDTFINWRLGTQASFDAIVPLGSRPHDLVCRRPTTGPRQEGARAIAEPGQRTRISGSGSGGDNSASFRQLSNTDKLRIALTSAAGSLGPEAKAKLAELASTSNLAIMAGALTVWIGAQATPIGWVVSIGMAGMGVIAMGVEAFALASEIKAFAMGVVKASNEADLAQAGRHLAKAVAILGIELVIGLLTKKAVIKVREPLVKTGEPSPAKLFGKYDVADAAKNLEPDKGFMKKTHVEPELVPPTDLNKAPLLDPYKGVREASAHLKSQGVSRAKRKQILESFEVDTISVETAGDNLYGLRFHDGGKTASAQGQYLFETFTPQTNRSGLALPPDWNGMTGLKQWQITPGTTVIRGKAAPQLDHGSQYGGGVDQMFVLEPWKHGSLK